MASEPTAALITGGARGIGKKTAERFGDDGDFDRVILFDVKDMVHDTAEEIAGGEGFQIDVRNHDEVHELVDSLEEEVRITAAVNNASVSSGFELEELEPEEWDRIVTTNMKGYYNIARAICPRMYDREYGRLVNLSSGAGQRGSLSGGVHYSASKAGVIGLTKGLAKQLGPHVSVNCIVPGLIDTFEGKERKFDNLWTEDGFERYKSMLPAKRLGEPDEVARVIHFLSGSGADYMTGSVVNVDGGGDVVPTKDFLMR